MKDKPSEDDELRDDTPAELEGEQELRDDPLFHSAQGDDAPEGEEVTLGRHWIPGSKRIEDPEPDKDDDSDS